MSKKIRRPWTKTPTAPFLRSKFQATREWPEGARRRWSRQGCRDGGDRGKPNGKRGPQQQRRVNFTAPRIALATATQLASAAPASPALPALFTATVVAARK